MPVLPEPGTALPAPHATVLAVLLKAHDAAREHGADPLQWAVEIPWLYQQGVSATDLRLLLSHGWVEQWLDATSKRATQRCLTRVRHHGLSDQGCLVLRPDAVEPARQLLPAPAGVLEPARPVWHSRRRVLSYRGLVVKRFRVWTPNQIPILEAFEEEGWPVMVYSPLSADTEYQARAMLNDAVKRLNRTHVTPGLLRFHGDGTGEGIRWEALDVKAPA
jgi:hypothetical protein